MTWSRNGKVWFFAVVVGVFLISASASASAIDGKKGIGYGSAIGGPHGLTFQYGINRLAIETIIGF
ncbi:MAG: hypothetical protein VX589_08395, partial [Myxococcota bacterium]|nr:hypothetical protein [Myxococcota bacterium]